MKTTLTLLALSLGVSAGCNHVSPDDPHRADLKVPAIENTYEMVGLGKPPLSLVVYTGGWIKVLDATDNTLIHTAQLPSNNTGMIIRLDPDLKALTYTNGKFDPTDPPETAGASDKAEKPHIQLPINPDHRYELYYQR